MEQFAEIAAAFQCPGRYLGDEAYGSGHINDTFKATYDEEEREVHYIHQRRKFEEAGADQIDRRVLTLIPAVDGRDFYQDSEGSFWRTYVFIEDAIGIDVIENTDQAYKSAKAFGEFQCQLADLPGRLNETIPKFHHTRSRYDTLMQVIEADAHGRVANAQAEIAFVKEREELVDVVIELMASGEIPERVTHNDTKLNNVLMDCETDEGMCVIDLDTVMPGSVLYDFGDMIRTSTNQAVEDETDLSKVEMNIDYFEALVKGYLETASGFLVPKEKDLLAFSGKLISFEIGLRFLTDYLQGDVYFKTHRAGQNIDRCRKQFKMVQSMERQMEAMEKIVERYWNNAPGNSKIRVST